MGKRGQWVRNVFSDDDGDRRTTPLRADIKCLQFPRLFPVATLATPHFFKHESSAMMTSFALRSLIAFASLHIGVQSARIPSSARLHRRFTFVARPAPEQWQNSTYEDYDEFRFRYLTLGCHQKKENQSFYETCCHPRLKNQTLDSIPVECQLDPQSLIMAHEYIMNSTQGKAEITSGMGKPVYVKKGSIRALQPELGHNSSSPPTSQQVAQLLQAQSKIKSLSNSSSILNDTLATSNTTSPVTPVNHASTSHVELKSPKDVIDQAASAKIAAEQTASDKAAADQAAADQAAADQAAFQKKASDEAAKKAASDEAAKKAASTQSDNTKDVASQVLNTASQATSSATSLSGVSQVYGGDGSAKGTFFYQEGAAGACGNVNSDSTPLVALPTDLYANGVHCGKSVLIKNTANGKTVVAKVQDMCPGCPSADSLDLSTGAYDAIGAQSTGVLPIQWGFISN
ncbi:hypothetical protein O181_030165 [Austropuccinia psidii MF-1]|uniref:RlpA-like protein double-psi beta-barrel domain-containing protein n=1 Tax=Austropuccinia psidii MF-1 TaxID=1389203 RepID=A0A9Q3H5Y3_9BASI|nr:hypothetical protein [Austropuccinia psidii MF-1]